MARRHRAVSPFVLDLMAAAGDRRRVEIHVLVVDAGPAELDVHSRLEAVASARRRGIL